MGQKHIQIHQRKVQQALGISKNSFVFVWVKKKESHTGCQKKLSAY